MYISTNFLAANMVGSIQDIKDKLNNLTNHLDMSLLTSFRILTEVLSVLSAFSNDWNKEWVLHLQTLGDTEFPQINAAPQISTAHLGIHTEITTSLLLSTVTLNAVLIRIVTIFY